MSLNPPSPDSLTTTESTPQARRRLGWLWTTLQDDRRRRRLLFVVGLAILGAVGAIGFLTYQVQAIPFDVTTTLELQEIHGNLFRNLMYLVSLPGYMPWSPILVGLGAIVVGLRLGWRDGGYLVLITLCQGLANHLVKTVIGRPRPANNLVEVFLPNHGNSFPSGHVMLYTVFFGFLFFLAWSRLRRSLWRTLALVLSATMILLVGPARIYLGAHWLSDVVAAHLLALVILLFAIEFYIQYVAPTKRQVQQQA